MHCEGINPTYLSHHMRQPTVRQSLFFVVLAAVFTPTSSLPSFETRFPALSNPPVELLNVHAPEPCSGSSCDHSVAIDFDTIETLAIQFTLKNECIGQCSTKGTTSSVFELKDANGDMVLDLRLETKNANRFRLDTMVGGQKETWFSADLSDRFANDNYFVLLINRTNAELYSNRQGTVSRLTEDCTSPDCTSNLFPAGLTTTTLTVNGDAFKTNNNKRFKLNMHDLIVSIGKTFLVPGGDRDTVCSEGAFLVGAPDGEGSSQRLGTGGAGGNPFIHLSQLDSYSTRVVFTPGIVDATFPQRPLGLLMLKSTSGDIALYVEYQQYPATARQIVVYTNPVMASAHFQVDPFNPSLGFAPQNMTVSVPFQDDSAQSIVVRHARDTVNSWGSMDVVVNGMVLGTQLMEWPQADNIRYVIWGAPGESGNTLYGTLEKVIIAPSNLTSDSDLMGDPSSTPVLLQRGFNTTDCQHPLAWESGFNTEYDFDESLRKVHCTCQGGSVSEITSGCDNTCDSCLSPYTYLVNLRQVDRREKKCRVAPNCASNFGQGSKACTSQATRLEDDSDLKEEFCALHKEKRRTFRRVRRALRKELKGSFKKSCSVLGGSRALFEDIEIVGNLDGATVVDVETHESNQEAIFLSLTEVNETATLTYPQSNVNMTVTNLDGDSDTDRFDIEVTSGATVTIFDDGACDTGTEHSASKVRVYANCTIQLETGGGTQQRYYLVGSLLAVAPPSPPPSPPTSPSSPTSSSAVQDPHLALAHGGRTDFRGKNATLYNFVSARNVSLNVRTEDATFRLQQLVVHGSFMTEAHFSLRTREGRFLNVSFVAARLNEFGWSWRAVNGSCALPGNRVVFTLGPHSERRCDNLKVTMDLSTAVIETVEWRFTVRGMPVYDRMAGPHHRVDLVVTQKVPDDAFQVRPHGLLGQSYDGDNAPRKGRLDVYPTRNASAEFTTRAMGEGAIDGRAFDYEMYAPYATEFRFARFGTLKATSVVSTRRTNGTLSLRSAGAYDDAAIAAPRRFRR